MRTLLQRLKEQRVEVNNSRDLTDDEIIVGVEQAEVLAHDVACELFSTATGFNIGDVNPRDIIKEWEFTRRQTPDIFHKAAGTQLYIGDVAVTVDEETALRSKQNKYRELITYAKKIGYDVTEVWIIVRRDCLNLGSLVNKWALSKHPTKADMYTMTEASNISSDIIQKLESKITNWGYYRSRRGRIAEERTERLFDQVPELEDIIPKTRHLSDEDIYKIAITKADELRAEGYYDQGEKSDIIIDSFEKIYDKLSLVDHKKIEDFLLVGGCYHEKEDLDEYQYIEAFRVFSSDADGEVARTLNGYIGNFDVKEAAEAEPNKRSGDHNKGMSRWEIKPKNTRQSSTFEKWAEKLQYGKKKKNLKKPPRTLKREDIRPCMTYVDEVITYLGEESNKSPPKLGNLRATNPVEEESYKNTQEGLEKLSKTNAIQMANSLENVTLRVYHTKSSICSKARVFVPPNKAFLLVIPAGHAPSTGDNTEVPMLTFYRSKTKLPWLHQYEYFDGHYYYMSKLFRLNMSKMRNWINSDARIVTGCESMSIVSEELKSSDRLVGTVAIFTLDIHQKTSEMLDLFKYVAWMPQSELTRLNKLITDKFDILHKTPLDIWVSTRMKQHMIGLAMSPKPSRPVVNIKDDIVSQSSFGVNNLSLPSFIDDRCLFTNPQSYCTEVALLFCLRGKKLYGDQFMDHSFNSYIGREESLKSEIKESDWAFFGYDPEKPFPFESKYAYSRDLILEMIKVFETNPPVNTDKLKKEMYRETVGKYAHEICSLRGCMKDDYKDSFDIHSTSMHEALKHYNKKGYKEEECRFEKCATESLKDDYIWKFSMSAKEQRGGGRVICSPSFLTKVGLRAVEGPEMAYGKYLPDNVLVAGVNKINAVQAHYSNTLVKARKQGQKIIAQVTEDQSKWSEEDNLNKYVCLTENRLIMSEEVSKIQQAGLHKLKSRLHFNAREVKSVTENGKDIIYRNMPNCVQISHGWPQGMLNHISTTLHSYVSRYSIILWNKFNSSEITAEGEVNSDDSHLTISAQDWETIERFTIFRNCLKKMCCIRVNDKKTYVSSWCGEMVSNFCLNGQMVSPWIKTAINAFENEQFFSYQQDVKNIMGNLHQMMTGGTPLPIVALVEALSKTKLDASYSMKNFRYNRSLLPLALGGYPESSVFEMATVQEACHEVDLREKYSDESNQSTDEYKATITALALGLNEKASLTFTKNTETYLELAKELEKKVHACEGLADAHTLLKDNTRHRKMRQHLSMLIRIQKADIKSLRERIESVKPKETWEMNELLQSIEMLPREGDIFHYITTAVPVRKSVLKTVNSIKALPFEDDGLSQLVTRPKTIAQSLGHLKGRSLNNVYELSESGYTRNKRKMYAQQAIMATGKAWGTRGTDAKMTLSMLIAHLSSQHTEQYNHVNQLLYLNVDLDTAFISTMARTATTLKEANKGTSMVNLQPLDIFNRPTINKIKDVLLFIQLPIGFEEYVSSTVSQTLLSEDAERIRKAYKDVFTFYPLNEACSVILKAVQKRRQKKYWISSPADKNTRTTFYKDIYQNSLSYKKRVVVRMSHQLMQVETREDKLIETMVTFKLASLLYNDPKLLPENWKLMVEELRGLNLGKLSEENHKKFTWLMYRETEDEGYLTNYKNASHYHQTYLKKQKYIGGRYAGDLRVKGTMGTTACIIDGEPGNFHITSNTRNPLKIMQVMKHFVDENFKESSYKDYKHWGLNKVWGGELYSSLYINFYSRNATVVEKTPGGSCSIPLYYDKFLEAGQAYSTQHAMAYKLDPKDHSKVFYQVIGLAKETVDIVSFEERTSWRVLLTIQTYPKIPLVSGMIWHPEARIAGVSVNTLVENNCLIEALGDGSTRIEKDRAIATLGSLDQPILGIIHMIFNANMVFTKKLNEVVDLSALDVLEDLYKDAHEETIIMDFPQTTWESYAEELQEASNVRSDELKFGSDDAIMDLDNEQESMTADIRIGTMYKRTSMRKQLVSSLGLPMDDKALKKLLSYIYTSAGNIEFYKNNLQDMTPEEMVEVRDSWVEGLRLEIDKRAMESLMLLEGTIVMNGWGSIKKLMEQATVYDMSTGARVLDVNLYKARKFVKGTTSLQVYKGIFDEVYKIFNDTADDDEFNFTY
uniref:RNA-directed RNA polymerase L n=1 Tax=Prorhinotermes inopinatus phasmavirus 2 TaxID=3133475 RepID=A0AAT9JFJ9_9VIRU